MNGIPPLVQLVSYGSIEAQESAARALWHLASSNEAKEAIAESGGIGPLVSMLSVEDERSQEIATVPISRLEDCPPHEARLPNKDSPPNEARLPISLSLLLFLNYR